MSFDSLGSFNDRLVTGHIPTYNAEVRCELKSSLIIVFIGVRI